MGTDDGVVADTWLFQNPADPDDAISYRLANFPIEPWKLTHTRSLWITEDDARTAASWLDDVASDRLAIFGEISQRLGAPGVDYGNPVPGLAELGSWLQAWFHLAGAHLVESGFLQPQSAFRLGTVYSDWRPDRPGYSATGDALIHSLVVDLAMLVSARARVLQPDLAWSVHVADQSFVLVLRESSPVFAPLQQIWDLLRESVGFARGERDRNFWRRRSRILVDCFQQAVTGVTPPPVAEGFSEYSARSESRFRLKRPSRATPPPPSYLLDAVTQLRSIGWFESWNRSDEALAQAAAIEWQRATSRELPSDTAELWWCLLFLDGRTWFEDVDMQILPGDWLYMYTLFALEKIGGKGFGGFSDPEDDWSEVDGSVVLTFRWRRRKHRLVIRHADGVLDPHLFMELNALLPDDTATLHFADHGPGVGIVVRATEPERTAFTELTGIRLADEPPAWWRRAVAKGPASLRESPGFDPLVLGAPPPSAVIQEAFREPTLDDEDLRRVSITDYETDGEVVIQVCVPIAEFLRGGEVERALDEGLHHAIGSLTGVTAVHRTDREIWEVSGDPDGAELEDAATSAVSNVLDRFADEIEL